MHQTDILKLLLSSALIAPLAAMAQQVYRCEANGKLAIHTNLA